MDMSYCFEKWLTSYHMDVDFSPENEIFMIEIMRVGDSYVSIFENAKSVNINIP